MDFISLRSHLRFCHSPRDVASLRARNEELEKEISSLQTRIIDLNQQLSEAESCMRCWVITR
jgi:predicted  nucleic acid-binding Zn-ribbon protein